MCGISGLLEPDAATGREALEQAALAMASAIRARGPDDHGVWADPARGLALAHRRLSILDLTVDGRQPMLSGDRRFVLVFNGEIYNFAELRAELEGAGRRFRGRSDTEVMLEAFAVWGCRRAIERFQGMFAFALWDSADRTLTLARDRFGEKPLYYGWNGPRLLFGSELKAIAAHPEFEGRVNRGALALYLRYNCVPAPYSIYEGVHKLPPATTVVFGPGTRPGFLPEPQVYWSAAQVAVDGAERPSGLGDDAAVEALDVLLRDIIRKQMVADVPLGAFLSGGVDSSAVVAIMQAQSSRPVKTFTIGFHEKGYDEAQAARAVAAHLGTEHTELYAGPAEALAVVPRLASIYDEPFGDSSQIPTFLVAELARRHVTVSLSGDAGDELFGGYNRYVWGPNLWKRLKLIPQPVRAGVAGLLGRLSDPAWRSAFELAGPLLPKMSLPLDKIHKLVDTLDARSLEDVYLKLRGHWSDPGSVLRGDGLEPDAPLVNPPRWPRAGQASMACVDALTYLPDDILVKVDRATMAVSLEGRAPFLDHRLAEFAWSLKPDQRIRNGKGKWILREVLARYAPRELFERPKTGFSAPIGAWLRGELRDWAEALLDERRLGNEGFFDVAAVRARWQEHLSGRRNRQHQLWDVLMFQAWLEHVRSA